MDGQQVYVHFGHMGTAALSLDGKVAWKNDTIKYPPVHGNGGTPALRTTNSSSAATVPVIPSSSP